MEKITTHDDLYLFVIRSVIYFLKKSTIFFKDSRKNSARAWLIMLIRGAWPNMLIMGLIDSYR